ncbi:UNKNOWN [Stylonychia lemnae]|uniref:Uncharacterized protein n=1 Tax=Stylonychia lemnae TaxID=5949 RepID=A0A078A0K7_STYLE|nr:UNKNOWN [Stylonychia lemnae]|eukprot:CDW75387.1 UNKNOWN [Stylonychia lemnae]
MDYNQKRLSQTNHKVKIPYKMLQGMQKKSIERANVQKDMDRKLGVIADTNRLGPKKMMQGYFERKEEQKKEISRQNLDKDRGINLHLYSAAKFRDGALNLTKEGIRKIEEDDDGSGKQHRLGPKKNKKTFDEIQNKRQSNPEYMTGKRFRKKKGNVAKKFKGKKKGSKRSKH